MKMSGYRLDFPMVGASLESIAKTGMQKVKIAALSGYNQGYFFKLLKKDDELTVKQKNAIEKALGNVFVKKRKAKQ